LAEASLAADTGGTARRLLDAARDLPRHLRDGAVAAVVKNQDLRHRARALRFAGIIYAPFLRTPAR